MFYKSYKYYVIVTCIAFALSIIAMIYGIYAMFTSDFVGMLVGFLLAIYLQFDAKVSNVEAKIAKLEEKSDAADG
jgi:uncharacterized membrane protein